MTPQAGGRRSDATEALAARLRSRLTAGAFSPGERVGDERSLAADLGISRAALRPALAVLEAEGLIRRLIGRAGGIVAADGRIERNLNTVQSLPEIVRAQGLSLTTEVIRVGLTSADDGDQRRLALKPGAFVYDILRLRSAGGQPLSVEHTRAPAAIFLGLLDQDLSSFYCLSREVYGLIPASSDETLQVDAADRDTAALLRIDEGAPVVRVARVTADAAGRPIESGEERFVAGRMRFHLRRTGRVRLNAS
jgi:GntR family transcriptional regulator